MADVLHFVGHGLIRVIIQKGGEIKVAQSLEMPSEYGRSHATSGERNIELPIVSWKCRSWSCVVNFATSERGNELDLEIGPYLIHSSSKVPWQV